MSNKLLKFNEKEFNEIKKGIRELFNEEIQSHKSKNFMEIGINNNYNTIIHIFTDKFSVYLKKVLSKDNKILIKSNVELFDISKNNIKKNSDRVRWIIETVDKVVKLNNSYLTKIEIFTKLYKDSILKDLKKENIDLISESYIDFIVFCDNDVKIDFFDENNYNFIILNSNIKFVTKDILNKVNRVINMVLKYWNSMIN